MPKKILEMTKKSPSMPIKMTNINILLPSVELFTLFYIVNTRNEREFKQIYRNEFHFYIHIKINGNALVILEKFNFILFLTL